MGSNEKELRDWKKVFRFSDDVASKKEWDQEKKWVKHNSKDLRIGDWKNLAGEQVEEAKGEDYITFSWQVLKIKLTDKVLHWIWSMENS